MPVTDRFPGPNPLANSGGQKHRILGSAVVLTACGQRTHSRLESQQHSALDSGRLELRKRGVRIRLPASRNRLLLLPVTRRGDLVTREEIAACLWKNAQNVEIVGGINTAVNHHRNVPQFGLELARATDSGELQFADLSPDGNYLIYVRDESGMQGLFLKQLATGRKMQLVTLGEDECLGLAFSPDGTYVYFARRKPQQPSEELYRSTAVIHPAASRLIPPGMAPSRKFHRGQSQHRSRW